MRNTFLKKKNKKLIHALLIFIVVLVFFYVYGKYQRYSVSDDRQVLIDRVGKLIMLPRDEVPTIATVTNLGPLQKTPFFINARLGDKVLMYGKSGKAILYRPTEDQIIEIGPLNLNKVEK